MARRGRVSLGIVEKLRQQRRKTGDLRNRHRYSGRKPVILARHRQRMMELLDGQPDMTLEEPRTALSLDCTVKAVFYVLADMDLT